MPDKRTIPRTCERCATPFLATAIAVTQGGGRFCTRECSNASRSLATTYANRSCERCGVAISVRRDQLSKGRGKYCSRDCSRWAKAHGETHPRWLGGDETRPCRVCGAPFLATRQRINQGLGLYCSRSCGRKQATGAKSSNWKGGRFFDGLYWYVKVATGHYRAEHRVLVEQSIGRRLTTAEHVHHINRVKTDNRLENLRVMSASDHSKLHQALDDWSTRWVACLECGTTERAHKGRGLCTACYARNRR